jgi:hypothetical protein
VSYRTVLSDVRESRESLIRLWSENLHHRGDLDEKLRWFYLDAPSGPGEAFLLTTEDDIVGCCGLTLRELYHRGQPIRAALLADFAIDKRHRSALPALTLQRAVKRHTDGAYDLSYGFPNDGAVAVLKRIGYLELGRMARFVRVLRHAPFLARRYRRPLLGRAAAMVVDPASLAISTARSLRNRVLLRLEWLEDFDARFDRLWDLAQPRELIACRRSSQFLRWRFARKPSEHHHIAGLVERQTSALAAYAVMRGEIGGEAELVDLFGINPGAIDDLLSQLIPSLYSRGYTSVSFRYLGSPMLLEVLAKHMFSLRESRRLVIVNFAPTCPIDATVAADPTRWYLTDLDEDT